MQLTGIEEVESLHHDEHVEDEGEVPGGDACEIVDVLVVDIAIDLVGTAAPDGASDHTVVPLVFGVVGKGAAVERVDILRDDVLTRKDEDHHDSQLVDRLPDDVLEHGLGDDVLVS